jgi:hypothetical protein
MKTLYLEDMEGDSEEAVLEHLSVAYSEDTDKDSSVMRKSLEGWKVLVAYESVGNWGCDSSSWYLLVNTSGDYGVISGAHCSCYGFEGQGEIEATEVEYLKSDNFYLPTGGYDDDGEKNSTAVKEYLAAL